jgi:hypothetical protein
MCEESKDYELVTNSIMVTRQQIINH